MTALSKALSAATVVLAAAAFLFQRQTTELIALQRTASAPVVATPPASAKSWHPPPRAQRPPPQGRLLDKLEAKVRGIIGPAQIASFTEAADEQLLGRLALIAGLTDDERAAMRREFGVFRLEKARLQAAGGVSHAALAAMDQRREAWLAAQLGPERAAAWQAAETSREQAGAERDAAAGMNRIARAVSLSAEQKDMLYARLLDKAAHPAAREGDAATRLMLNATISDDTGVAVPAIHDEARAILTPEQRAVYEANTAASARSSARMQEAMMSLVPALLGAAQELLDEGR